MPEGFRGSPENPVKSMSIGQKVGNFVLDRTDFPTLVRYLSISLVCLLVQNSIVIFGYEEGFGIIAPAIASFLVTALIAYYFHCRFTFRRKMTWRGFFHYTSAMSINIPMSSFFLWIFKELLGQPIFISAIAMTSIMIPWNYANGLISSFHGRARVATKKD